MRLPRGILLAIEGIDGAGKTTQADSVRQALEAVDLEVTVTHEPTRGPWGQKLRESARAGRLSLDEELEAFLEDRREHVRDLINPALAAGQVVIVNRYFGSTAAYQGARGRDPEELLQHNESFAPKPDLMVILDVPVQVGLGRIHMRGDKPNAFEQAEMLKRAAEMFVTLRCSYIINVNGIIDAGHITRMITDAIYRGPLFQRLCPKGYKDDYEPGFCSDRISRTCPYIAMGRLGLFSIDLSDLAFQMGTPDPSSSHSHFPFSLPRKCLKSGQRITLSHSHTAT